MAGKPEGGKRHIKAFVSCTLKLNLTDSRLDQQHVYTRLLPFICHIRYTITRNVITSMERHPVQDKLPISISLLAQSAVTRIGFALVLIVLTWLGVQWAVALQ
ncbi:hypothetical protein FB480_1021 [Agrobacterium vitis]|nr:hypothetical protein FB480_1021 [Agrobacterium vitis]